ncbi:hypothetical protein GCM10009560_75980 [Nonomuraea longicatena]|uniref:Uncharacterized protein n=1 Tax=Nonomuraea longicatena TaxID=83682 RepID=A0ABN1R853_9ACTN
MNPVAFADSLARHLGENDVGLTEHLAVRGFATKGGRVVAVRTDDGDLDCSAAAAGPFGRSTADIPQRWLPSVSGRSWTARPPSRASRPEDRNLA